MYIQIANPFHQQHPTPNLLIKLQLGLIGKVSVTYVDFTEGIMGFSIGI